MRARIALSNVLAVLLALMLPAMPAQASPPPEKPNSGIVIFGQAPEDQEEEPYAVAAANVDAVPDSDTSSTVIDGLECFRPPASGPAIRIALVSTGVDEETFPTAALRSQVTPVADFYNNATLGDDVGYGTWAASALLQLDRLSGTRRLDIKSIPVFPDGLLRLEYIRAAFDHLVANASDYDVVLLAMPPIELQHPILGAMNFDVWDTLLDAVAAGEFAQGDDTLLGIPKDDAEFAAAEFPMRGLVAGFRHLALTWSAIIEDIETLYDAGLMVVAPAGDVPGAHVDATGGASPQSISGLANLERVLTVGGFRLQISGGNLVGSMSLRSGVGPSISMGIKPDLLAPTGLQIFLPSASAVGTFLQEEDTASTDFALDSTIAPRWGAGAPSGSVGATLDSTLTAAAVAAVAVGSIAAGDGTIAALRDPDAQRGALYARSQLLLEAASKPEEVWRQGAGVLGGLGCLGLSGDSLEIPTPSFVSTAPLVKGFGNFGREPSSGTWSVTLPLEGEDYVPSGESSAFDVPEGSDNIDYIGTDIYARAMPEDAAASASPTVTAADGSTGAFTLSSTIGNATKEAGLYAGYLEVDVTRTVGGTPYNAVRKVPYQLNNAFRPTLRAFYPHNRSVDNASFDLVPDLPYPSSVFNHPLMVLPGNPIGFAPFFRLTRERDTDQSPAATATPTPVTPDNDADDCPDFDVTDGTVDSGGTCHGQSHFHEVSAGYYRVRLWADYRAPVDYPITSGGSPATTTGELGQDFGYTSFNSLLLPRIPKLPAGVSPGSPPDGCVESYGTNSGEDHGADDGTDPGDDADTWEGDEDDAIAEFHDDWSGHTPDTAMTPSVLAKTWKVCSEKWLNYWLMTVNNLTEEQASNEWTYRRETASFQLDSEFVLSKIVPGWNTLQNQIKLDLIDRMDNESPINLNLGFARKSVGTAVVGRVTDLIHPCDEMGFSRPLQDFRPIEKIPFDVLEETTDDYPALGFQCDNAENLVATIPAGDQPSAALGETLMWYPFTLPEPNFSAHMSLNFAYEVRDAIIGIEIKFGGDPADPQSGTTQAFGAVTPHATLQAPPAGDPIWLATLDAQGHSQGRANFEFDLLPKGETYGVILFSFAPAPAWVDTFTTDPLTAAVGLPYARILDYNGIDVNNDGDFEDANDIPEARMFFELSTWAPAEWPAINFSKRGSDPLEPCTIPQFAQENCGHTFTFNSHYSPWVDIDPDENDADPLDDDPYDDPHASGQMKPGDCARITQSDGTTIKGADLCDDTSILVHLPFTDDGVDETLAASVMDILSAPDPEDSPQNSVSILRDNNGNGVTDAGDTDGIANPDDVMIYTPQHAVNKGHLRYQFAQSLTNVPSSSPLCADNDFECGPFKTNGNLFEQLLIKDRLLRDYQGQIEICLNDRDPQWDSGTEGFIESICDGSFSGSTWNASTVDVPCILRERGAATDECSIDAGDSVVHGPAHLPRSFLCYVNTGDMTIP